MCVSATICVILSLALDSILREVKARVKKRLHQDQRSLEESINDRNQK